MFAVCNSDDSKTLHYGRAETKTKITSARPCKTTNFAVLVSNSRSWLVKNDKLRVGTHARPWPWSEIAFGPARSQRSMSPGSKVARSSTELADISIH